jgi:hypothetical protein
MACGAITSARLCARQPSARSPRTASHAGAFTSPTHADNGGVACAIIEDVKHGSTNMAAMKADIFIIVPILPYPQERQRTRMLNRLPVEIGPTTAPGCQLL